MSDGCFDLASDAVFLRAQTKVEPLACGWYAWPHLIAPAQLARNLCFRLLPLLQSFVTNPSVHVAASADPKMYGGPFVGLPLDQAPRVKQLMDEIRRRFAPLLTLAEDLRALSESLETHATGYSLHEFYRNLPESLRGLVECVYDGNNHASVRIFERLLYDDGVARRAQEISLQLVDERERQFFMSTPRLDGQDRLRFSMQFSDERIDVLAEMRRNPRRFDEVATLFGISGESLPAFARFFTSEPPSLNVERNYMGDGVRMRYFGHACVLFQTNRLSILFDPFVALENRVDGRFTFGDLPDFIDYVVLTHAHQDHFSAEMLLQLRRRIGRVIVPPNNGGSIVDPSMKLILRELGFVRIDVIEPFDSIAVPDGEILSLPFTGEHADLNIHSKHAIALTLKGRKHMLLVDSDGIDMGLYRRMIGRIGPVDTLFLGMECHGAPMNWLYEAVIDKPVSRKNNESRRLSGANCERAWNVMQEVRPSRVFVYAMGQEPWMQYIMGLQYEPDSVQLIESNRFLERCEQAGIEAERLFCRRELEFTAALERACSQ